MGGAGVERIGVFALGRDGGGAGAVDEDVVAIVAVETRGGVYGLMDPAREGGRFALDLEEGARITPPLKLLASPIDEDGLANGLAE